MNPAAIDLLQLVSENLRASDPMTYQAVEQAMRQGAKLEVQLTFGSEPSIALGFTDDYGTRRWVHTCELQ